MKKRSFSLIIVFVLLISIFIYLNNKSKYLSTDDIIGVYVNNELNGEIPSKGSAMFQKAVCDDENTKVTWDNDKWGLLISNINKKTKCNLYFYSGQTAFNFDYTGGEQTFIAPISGTYKVETWGAQGSTNLGTSGKTSGGYGGYSVGFIDLKNNDNIYINVGQNYNYNGLKLVAYNGGGLGDMPGGGATHIAFSSGELYTLENSVDKIIIASGGGGGEDTCENWNTATETIVSGSGGGFKGVDSCLRPGYGGTQSNGGSGYNNGTFGKGGNSGLTDDSGGGGGGGFYGGGSGDNASYSSGGGGSGYIGNPLLKNKAMYCYNCEESSEESTKTISTTCSEETPTSNCAKKGNGYARITLVSIDE